MLRSLCLALCYVVVGASPLVKDDSRILNGRIATEGQFPFAVSLQYDYPEYGRQHYCTLSLITAKTCLGAAHCLFTDSGELITAESLCGVVGTIYQDSDSDCKEYASVLHHEKYDPKHTINDIALFILKHAIDLGGDVRTVKLAGPSKEINGKTVTALGWGQMVTDEPLPHRLRYTSLLVEDQSLCNDLYANPLRDDQVCLSGEETGICGGDSGGPIILSGTNVQIALVSYGTEGCNADPSVHTDTSKFKPWIQQHADGEPEFEG